jgi:hypothetical protein
MSSFLPLYNTRHTIRIQPTFIAISGMALRNFPELGPRPRPSASGQALSALTLALPLRVWEKKRRGGFSGSDIATSFKEYHIEAGGLEHATQATLERNPKAASLHPAKTRLLPQP